MADIQDQSHQEYEKSEYPFRQVKMCITSGYFSTAGDGSQGRSLQEGVDTSENPHWSLRGDTGKNGSGWRFQLF